MRNQSVHKFLAVQRVAPDEPWCGLRLGPAKPTDQPLLSVSVPLNQYGITDLTEA